LTRCPFRFPSLEKAEEFLVKGRLLVLGGLSSKSIEQMRLSIPLAFGSSWSEKKHNQPPGLMSK
jgi:hypothetical protein